MPTRLPSGLLIYNATAHDLDFWCGNQMVRAPVDYTLDAKVRSYDVHMSQTYKLITYEPTETEEGRKAVTSIKERYPDALIVGSLIAAQAYREDVVSIVPLKEHNRTDKYKYNRHVRSDRFTVFKKEKSNAS